MEELKKIIQKAGPLRLGAVVLCGIMLLLISCGGLDFFSQSKSSLKETESGLTESTESESLQEYRSRMEKELVGLLEQVQGVGNVEVMLTVSASNEKITLKDNTSEEKEETVLVEDSDRNSSPYVVQEKEPELEGVVVVCDGGGDATVKREITEAVSALFQIESHKIKVMKSKEAKE